MAGSGKHTDKVLEGQMKAILDLCRGSERGLRGCGPISSSNFGNNVGNHLAVRPQEQLRVFACQVAYLIFTFG